MNADFRGHERLMMFYMLPENVLARTEIPDFTRDPYKAIRSKKWREIYESDYFDLVLTDCWAWLVWDYLGIRGGMEKYSGYDPFWQMAHAYPLWILTFRKMGLTAGSYFDGVTPGFSIGYMSHEQTDDAAGDMIEYFIKHSRYEEWKEVILECRTHQDFDTRRSGVKIDFYRKWGHTRAKVKVISITQVDDDQPYYNPYPNIDQRLEIERFLTTIDKKKDKIKINKTIVLMLLAGYTQAEIAEKLGYSNHTAVCKRIKRIGEKYREYMKPFPVETMLLP